VEEEEERFDEENWKIRILFSTKGRSGRAEAEKRKCKVFIMKSQNFEFALHSLVSHRQLKMNPTEIDGAES